MMSNLFLRAISIDRGSAASKARLRRAVAKDTGYLLGIAPGDKGTQPTLWFDHRHRADLASMFDGQIRDIRLRIFLGTDPGPLITSGTSIVIHVVVDGVRAAFAFDLVRHRQFVVRMLKERVFVLAFMQDSGIARGVQVQLGEPPIDPMEQALGKGPLVRVTDKAMIKEAMARIAARNN